MGKKVEGEGGKGRGERREKEGKKSKREVTNGIQEKRYTLKISPTFHY